MAFALFTQIFCCCRHPKVEIDDSYNEESHLIPQTDEPPITYGSDTVRIDHGKLQERLGHIVRAKEGKMVNVASHIPFNLHNQVIPPEPHSISRSASGSMDTHEERQYNPYYEYHSNRESEQPRHKFTTSGYPYGEGPPTRSPSVSSGLLPGPSHDTRIRSRYDQPRPTPILNVRLVGYSETHTRGRARERGPAPAEPALAAENNDNANENPPPSAEVRSETDELTPIQQSALIKIHDFKPMETIPITVSWSD